MAMTSGINIAAGSAKGADGRFTHSVSGPVADLALTWDPTKFTTKQSLLDAFALLENETRKFRGLA